MVSETSTSILRDGGIESIEDDSGKTQEVVISGIGEIEQKEGFLIYDPGEEAPTFTASEKGKGKQVSGPEDPESTKEVPMDDGEDSSAELAKKLQEESDFQYAQFLQSTLEDSMTLLDTLQYTEVKQSSTDNDARIVKDTVIASTPIPSRHAPIYSSPLRLGHYDSEYKYVKLAKFPRGPRKLKRRPHFSLLGLSKGEMLLRILGFWGNNLCNKAQNGCTCEYEALDLPSNINMSSFTPGDKEAILSRVPKLSLKGPPKVKDKCDKCIYLDITNERQQLERVFRSNDLEEVEIPDDETVVGCDCDENEDFWYEYDEDDDRFGYELHRCSSGKIYSLDEGYCTNVIGLHS